MKLYLIQLSNKGVKALGSEKRWDTSTVVGQDGRKLILCLPTRESLSEVNNQGTTKKCQDVGKNILFKCLVRI